MRRKIKTGFSPSNRRLIISILSFFICLPSAYCQSIKLLADDANADDRFGVSVAIDDNIAVVGAYHSDSNGLDSGAAFVYELSGSQWVQRQKLVASDGSSGDKFGRSVAVCGDTIVVGSYLDNNTGSAYVFSLVNSVWTQQQKLTASDADIGDKFASAVSISDDTIVIGAYGDNSYTGGAYIFTPNGSSWNQSQKLTASQAGDKFGASVAVSSDTIIVGAYGDSESTGAAYIFVRNGSDWSIQDVLRASDSNTSDLFGWSTAIDGNWVVIGATGIDAQRGAAYIFERNALTWSQRQILIDPEQPLQLENFGSSVAVRNDKIVIGCPKDLVADQNAGAIYQYVLAGSTWIYQDIYFASDSNEGDGLGSTTALSAEHLIAGAPYNDDNGASSGSAYLFFDDLLADFDGDNCVDFNDFAVLAAAWQTAAGQPSYNPDCDISNPPNSLIDTADLDMFCDDWLIGK